jgi:Zn-dependent protease
MIFSIYEVLDIIIMIGILGYLFHDVFRKPQQADDDVLTHYQRKRAVAFGVELNDFLWAAALIAPTVILHELAHKFVAMGFGQQAVFHAACSTSNLGGNFLDFYCGLTLIAVVMKAVGWGFLFFVPGYVALSGGTDWQNFFTAFAGPLVHLVFWLGSMWILRDKKRMKKMKEKHKLYLFFFKQINMFLFIFNMIPIPGFDGFKVFYYLFKALF